jgi:hypothetical protein
MSLYNRSLWPASVWTDFKDLEVDVWARIRIFEYTNPERRMRIAAYKYAVDVCFRDRTWTDMSPVPGCSRAGCEECYVHRHVIQEIQDDPYCPRSFNEHSLEPCLDPNPRTGLCDACQIVAEFGCGWGDHNCRSCIVDCHSYDRVETPCGECGPCDNPACVEANDDGHCGVVCPTAQQDNGFGG